MPHTISLRNISKDVAWSDEVRRPAVDGVTLEVFDRELLAIVGPRGSGKTTLLRMIAGLEAPSAGQMIIDGQTANHLPPRQRDIAFIPRGYGLFRHMSVAENIAFGIRMRRVPRTERTERA